MCHLSKPHRANSAGWWEEGEGQTFGAHYIYMCVHIHVDSTEFDTPFFQICGHFDTSLSDTCFDTPST